MRNEPVLQERIRHAAITRTDVTLSGDDAHRADVLYMAARDAVLTLNPRFLDDGAQKNSVNALCEALRRMVTP